MALWTFWLILAVGLLTAEIFTQSLTCLYVGIGAACAMTACLLGCAWPGALVTFLLSTTILYFATIKLRRKILYHLHNPHRHTATGMDALIGKRGNVEVTDRPRMRIDGDVWQVKSQDGATLQDGDQVEVVDYDSAVLIVTPILNS